MRLKDVDKLDLPIILKIGGVEAGQIFIMPTLGVKGNCTNGRNSICCW